MIIRRPNTRVLLGALGSLVTSVALLSACGDDDSPGKGDASDETGGKASTGGKSSTGGKASTGGSANTGGSKGGAGGAGGAGMGGSEPDGSTESLYERLGGHEGIRKALDKVVAAELKDSEIASFFVFQTMTSPPAGHPTADQLTECLTNQLGKAAGGSETFPGKLSSAFGGFTCRSMAEIHQPFHISGAQFDKFVTIAATTLMDLGVADDDIATIGTVLNSTKASIVDPKAPGGPFMPPDGGAPDSGPTTLYERLGGHAGIRGALEQVVTAELADTQIAAFFSAQTATTTPAGHPNANQLIECLTNQLGGAAGGPETYPLTLSAAFGSWQCRNMATIHQGLNISGTVFDKFVTIAATKLADLGVAQDDIATIGAVLNSTKTDIVTP